MDRANSVDGATAAERSLLGERFILQRRLGAGAFGIVYEAVDRMNKTVVALKELIAVDPASVSRFKAEFRVMADLHHPNLVALHELFAIDGRWFCTMDLVRGADFRHHVRLRGGSGVTGCDLERLRDALAQLIDAVSACHQAGYLHRDIKPSNILVKQDGQLVLLDFGLCSLTDALGNQASFNGSYAGTPAYTAPEVFRQESPTRASDWFSVGVVLYESLLGKLPFTSSWLMGVRGDTGAMLRDNLADVPADLRDICLSWLRFDPRERSGGDVLRGVTYGAGAERRSEPPTPLLIGRESALATLRQSWRAALQGEPVTVQVCGCSGIGKTTLVQHFLREVRASDSALVLEGRCFEHESVPYKALDVVLERLAKHLRRNDLPVADWVAPGNLEPLLQVFPCFRPLDEPFDADLHGAVGRLSEIRERAFLGLGDLLDALSRRWQLLLFIDDLQWADRDSAAALRSLLARGRGWPVLLVASYRSGAENPSAVVQLLDERARQTPRQSHAIELDALSPEEARGVVEALAPGSSAETLAHIYRETGGSPYLLRELGQELALRGPERLASLSNRTIIVRLEELTPIARETIELLALAGRPLDVGLFVPTDADAAELLPNAFAQLRKTRLTVSCALRGSEHVDVYHDKIREGVLAALEPERRKILHERLGMLLERSEASEPEELMHHFRASEDWSRVQRYALLAAQRASLTLAFARAADLFELVLGLPGGREDATLTVALAEALANSGRGLDAARAFRRAASVAPVEQRLALRRRAAEQFLRSGYIDEGRSELAVVLRAVGLRFSSSSGAALLSVLMQSARLKVRGLDFRPRTTPLEQSVRERLETCWAVSVGLASVDLIHAYQFVLEYLRLALDLGDAQAVSRGLCLYAGAVATEGVGRSATAAALLQRAEALAVRGDWHTQGWLLTERSVLTWSLGNWSEAVVLTEQALATFTEHCPNVAWEIAFLNLIRFVCLLELGQLERLGRVLPPLLADTLNRGDLFAVTNIRTKFLSFLALARDQPEEAWAEAEEASLGWSKIGWHYQHWFGVYGQAHVALYTGRGSDAHQLVKGCWQRLSKSLILRHQLARVHATSLLGRSALAAQHEGSPSSMFAEVERCAAKLENERLSYATACAAVLRAGVAADGRAARRHLEAATAAFSALGMKLHEAAARWRWGELVGDADGEAAVSAATSTFQAEGVVAPRRYVGMLIPKLRVSVRAH